MNKKLTDEELNTLIYDSYECAFVDYKLEYGLSKQKNSEVLLDIISFANSINHLNDRKFIIIGVKEGLTNEIIGVDQLIDSSSLQQLVNNNIKPKIELYSYAKEIEGKHVGVIEIRKTNTEETRDIYTLVKKYGDLERNTYCIRTHSSKEKRSILELSYPFGDPLLINMDVNYSIDQNVFSLPKQLLMKKKRSEIHCSLPMEIKNNTNAPLRIIDITISTTEKKKGSITRYRRWHGDIYEYVRRASKCKHISFLNLKDLELIVPSNGKLDVEILFTTSRHDRNIHEPCFMELSIDCNHFVIEHKYYDAHFHAASQRYIKMPDYLF